MARKFKLVSLADLKDEPSIVHDAPPWAHIVACALELVTTPASVRRFRSFLPYALHVTDIEARIVVNRAYQPVGWNGGWANYETLTAWHYPSQSEADQALMNILAFYTKNKTQLARIFRTHSLLGQRPKAKRVDYMNGLLNKALDRELSPVDVSGLTQQIAAVVNAANSNSTNIRFADEGDEPVTIHYLIDPWFPKAAVVGVYGRGATGKSSWVAQGCANASRLASTLWFSSEEPESHIRTRHMKCGGEARTLAVFVGQPTEFDPITKKVVATSFNARLHLEPAIAAFKANPKSRADRPLGIVVLDAVVALASWDRSKGQSSNDDEAVKKLIEYLQQVAERHDVTILILGQPKRHLWADCPAATCSRRASRRTTNGAPHCERSNTS